MKFLLSLILVFSCITSVHASDLQIIKVKDNIHVLISPQGGNVVVSTGEDGTFLIDDQLKGRSDTIEMAAASLGEGGVQYILNTHYHFDHTGGNEFFGGEGALIVAHDNVRKRLSEKQVITFFGKEMEPLSEEGLPKFTLFDKMTMHINGDTVQLAHAPDAHTDGDTVAYFADADVLVTGDLVFNGMFPFIDTEHGGSIRGLVAGLSMILDATDGDTVIIPGHGPVMTHGDLLAYHNAIVGIAKKVDASIQNNMSLDDTLAANVTEEYLHTLKDGVVTADQFVTVVYEDLKRK